MKTLHTTAIDVKHFPLALSLLWQLDDGNEDLSFYDVLSDVIADGKSIALLAVAS